MYSSYVTRHCLFIVSAVIRGDITTNLISIRSKLLVTSFATLYLIILRKHFHLLFLHRYFCNFMGLAIYLVVNKKKDENVQAGSRDDLLFTEKV